MLLLWYHVTFVFLPLLSFKRWDYDRKNNVNLNKVRFVWNLDLAESPNFTQNLNFKKKKMLKNISYLSYSIQNYKDKWLTEGVVGLKSFLIFFIWFYVCFTFLVLFSIKVLILLRGFLVFNLHRSDSFDFTHTNHVKLVKYSIL